MRLGEKLRRIRKNSGLSQGQMLLIVNPDEQTTHNRARVSQYERMKRIPSLIETQNYAQHAGVPVEVLINDELDLPPAAKTAKRMRKKLSVKRRSAKKESSTAVKKSIAVEATAARAAQLNDEPTDDVKKHSSTMTGDNAKMNSTTPLNASNNVPAAIRPTETSATADEQLEVEYKESDNRKYYENLLALSLTIGEDEARENLNIELPAETLDQFDDLLLDIRRELPRHLRSLIQTSDVVNFCLSVILSNYADHRKNSLVMFQTRKLIEDSERSE